MRNQNNEAALENAKAQANRAKVIASGRSDTGIGGMGITPQEAALENAKAQANRAKVIASGGGGIETAYENAKAQANKAKVIADPIKAMKARRDVRNPMFKTWDEEDEKSFTTGFNGK